MKKILVSGLVNIETSLKVECFPVYYCPIEYPFFGVTSCVSGVGFNIAKALKTLDDDIDLLSVIGNDLAGKIIKQEVEANKINTNHLLCYKDTKSAESVVLVDKEGKRKIYCDLKDIQDREPLKEDIVDLSSYSVLILTNINFNRHLIIEAKKRNITIASDVHTLSSIDDTYNELFLSNANILFLSNEFILNREEDFIKQIYNKFHNDIIVCGMGDKGALMYIGKENKFIYESAKAPYGVSSTVGAGDALFSSFIHFYNKGYELDKCLKKATLFAGIKISKDGASNGFCKEGELDD